MSAQPATSAPPELDHATKRILVIGLLSMMFLAALESTIVGPALPTIGRVLGDVELLPWVVTAYLITYTVAAPLLGKLSDSHGRRPLLIASMLIFLAGSTLCAVAPNMLVLIAGRALQGIGGGGLMSLVHAAIGDAVPPRERGKYQGYTGMMWMTASLAGPVLGGFISDHLHWSLIFWLNVPLGLAALWLSDGALRRLPAHHVRHKLDLLGAALLVGSAVALLLALNWGGNRYAWGSIQVIGLLVLAAALGAWLGRHVAREEEAILPIRLLANSVAAWATAAASMASCAFFGLAIYIPTYLESVAGLSPSQSGLQMLLLTGGTVVGATLAGQLTRRMVHYKRPGYVGMTGAAVAAVVMALNAGGMHLAVLGLCLAVIGTGVGAMFPIGTVALQNAVERRDIGIGTAFLSFARSLLGTLGVALFGALTAAALHATGPRAPALLASAFQEVFWLAALGFVLGIAALWRMPELPLRG